MACCGTQTLWGCVICKLCYVLDCDTNDIIWFDCDSVDMSKLQLKSKSEGFIAKDV